MTDIEPNKWHDRSRASSRTLQVRHGIPRTWYRRSLSLGANNTQGPPDYRFEEHINAAVVFHRDGQYRPGVAEAQWALVVRWPATPDTVTVVAVTADPVAWVKSQIARGARLWWVYDQYQPYRWRMPDLAAQPGPGRKVDHDEVIADFRAGRRVRDICEHYDISRQTLMNIRAKYGEASPRYSKEKAQD